MNNTVVLKNKRTTLERAEKFISPQYFTDINLRGRLYPEKASVELKHYAPSERIPYEEAIRGEFKETKIGTSFGKTWATHWFKVVINIPESWLGHEVRFRWNSGCEAMVWKSGQPIQGLSGQVQERTDYILTKELFKDQCRQELYVEMACNTIFGAGENLIGPPNLNKQFTLSLAEIAMIDKNVYGLLLDFELLIDIAKHLENENPRCFQALFAANKMINICSQGGANRYQKATEIAKTFFSQKNGESQHTIHSMGHCHIDSAWLWPYAETVRKCARSWSSVIMLMEKYPEFTFTCSQAQQYEWVKHHYPGLYEKIKIYVKKGRFIPVGGSWVEMDGNLPSGESFVRQFLIGQKFFLQEFGTKCKEFWLPDTFGYSAQLPQIICLAGMKRFLTQKLSWNLVNKFPHHTFIWQGIDGSECLVHFPPGDSYGLEGKVEDLLKTVKNYKEHGRVNSSILLYGFGDGGGGPTEEMIERLRKLKDVDGLPRVSMSTPEQFFGEIEKRESSNLCRWVGELYLELHQGTFTTQAKIKWWNRYLEFLLHNIEAISAISWVVTGSSYPYTQLDQIWKKVLLNQFHDVLPGSCIAEVVKDANGLYEEAFNSANSLLETGITSLFHHKKIHVKNRKDNNSIIIILNTHSWKRQEVIVLPEVTIDNPTDLKNKKLKCLTTQVNRNGETLALVEVDSIGFNVLCDPNIKPPKTSIETIKNGCIMMKNGIIEVTVDTTGRINSLKHVESGKETISSGCYGNQFVLFDDVPLFWDAWDVMDYHLETRKPLIETLKIPSIIENGCLHVAIEYSLKISENSYVDQVISLESGSPYVKFSTKVSWHENRKFLKVEFPVTVHSPLATYDIQFGHIQRPTNFNTSWNWAQYEMCGHKWVDLTEYNWGVSLLNNCKYGHSVHSNVIKMSLLRSPKAPDPDADMGEHSFTYGLFPHKGTFQEAGIIQAAYGLNNPLLSRKINVSDTDTVMPCSYFTLSDSSLIIETVKKAEDLENSLVVRLYEAYGSRGCSRMTSCLPVKSVKMCDILEADIDFKDAELMWIDGGIEITYRPFQIISLLIHF